MDKKLEERFAGIFGHFVLGQIRNDVPKFFDGKYIVARWNEDKKVTIVCESTMPKYEKDSELEVLGMLTDLTGQGVHVSVSPSHPRKIGELGPETGIALDSYVVAFVPPGSGFGNLELGPYHIGRPFPPEVLPTDFLKMESVDSLIKNTYVHFAFVPKK